MKKTLLFITVAFMGIKANAQAIAEYNFDNSSYADVNGNNSFASGANIVFTTDRHGNLNGALALNPVDNAPFASLPNGTNATIPNLPIGNQARTISFWINCNNSSNNNYYFSYGAATTNAAFGLGQFTTTTSTGGPKPTIVTKNDLIFFGYSNDLTHSPYKTNPTSWTHFVVTYTDAGLASIYINGVLTASATKVSWNTTNSVFRLGQTLQGTNTIIAYYDDLKIYNRAISAIEVSNLYTNNSLSTGNFNANNLKAFISPNPASDTFTIEMENGVKSVAIYSLLGQKVLTSNDKKVNISTLSKGTYLIQIEDEKDAISSQKLIIK